jgi:hypothetical protein
MWMLLNEDDNRNEVSSQKYAVQAFQVFQQKSEREAEHLNANSRGNSSFFQRDGSQDR